MKVVRMPTVKSYPKEKDKPQPKKRGRPSTYNKEIGDLICTRLSNGESLRSICKDEGMPERMVIMGWTDKFEEFKLQYLRARELQAESLVDDILEIADNVSDDDVYTDQGKRIAHTEWIQRSKIKMDARIWLASKILPKRYGNKIEVDNKGEVGLNITVKQFTQTEE